MKSQLRIFVSSTITECTDERRALRAGIKQLRHLPILFEDLGALPYPPRPLYLRELRTSDVFVGVYRNSYGWIDPRLGISGLHDEHNLRIQLGIPPLIYVLRNGDGRDPRLADLIAHAAEKSTLSFYDDPNALEEQIQRDLASLVSQAFDTSRLAVSTDPPSEAEIDAVCGFESLAQNILGFLAVADGPLAISDIAIATRAKIPEVLRSMSGLESQLVSTGDLVSLRTDVDVNALVGGIERQFYSYELAKVFEAHGNYLRALYLFDSIAHTDAEEIVGLAARAAVADGDLNVAFPLLERHLKQVQRSGWREAELSILLTVALLRVDSGDITAATQLILTAKQRSTPDWVLGIREVELFVTGTAKGDQAIVRDAVDLLAEFEREKDSAGAARVAVGLSKLLIESNQYQAAAGYAQQALNIFSDLEDIYGIRVAATNLAAALSGQRAPEARVREALRLADDAAPQESLRMKAFKCNLAARQHRRLGNPEQAAELSREAISLVQQLGDVRGEILNSINLGNALRDMNDSSAALSTYQGASVLAAKCGLRPLEASSTRLFASVLNDIGRHGEALPSAEYAAGLMAGAADRRELIEAKREVIRAHQSLGDSERALEMLAEVLKLSWAEPDDSLFVDVLEDAIAHSRDYGAGLRLPEILVMALGGSAPADFGDALMELVPQVPVMVARAPSRRRDRLCRELLRICITKFPKATRDRAALALAHKVLAAKERDRMAHFQLVLNILRVIDPSEMKLHDKTSIAEALARIVPGAVFKPFSDGSAHWTISIESIPMVMTIAQIDEDPKSWLACITFVYFLISVCKQWSDLAIGNGALHRSEASANVIVRSEFEKRISAEHAPSPDLLFSITRAADESADDPPPIGVILSDTFVFGEGSDQEPFPVSQLCCQFLYEVLRHLTKGALRERAMQRLLVPISLNVIS